jgi:hypothetical protein
LSVDTWWNERMIVNLSTHFYIAHTGKKCCFHLKIVYSIWTLWNFPLTQIGKKVTSDVSYQWCNNAEKKTGYFFSTTKVTLCVTP